MVASLHVITITSGVVAMITSTTAFAFTGVRLSSAQSTRRTHQRMMMKDDAPTEEAPKEGEKKKAPVWMYNKDGVALAPWMADAFDQENLDKIKASQEARRIARLSEVKESVGDLARDPQAMELSGVGLRSKNTKEGVLLEWRTADEKGNKGFIVSKRRGKTDQWVQIASFQDWAPLNSKGPGGGVYSYLDPTPDEGTWVYRISDLNTSGVRNDLCQGLVEVQSQSDANQVKLAVAFFGLVVAAAVASAFLIDPLQ